MEKNSKRVRCCVFCRGCVIFYESTIPYAIYDTSPQGSRPKPHTCTSTRSVRSAIHFVHFSAPHMQDELQLREAGRVAAGAGRGLSRISTSSETKDTSSMQHTCFHHLLEATVHTRALSVTRWPIPTDTRSSSPQSAFEMDAGSWCNDVRHTFVSRTSRKR